MAFEYNGVVYRDLEPQVRYNAEQIELLKQADVTLNNSLQFVNEDLQRMIKGKLDKPTNPSEESAVTMFADGTVGTKLLSEIGGGGGGKLYLHKIQLETSDGMTVAEVIIINSRSIEYPATESLDGIFTEEISIYFVNGHCVNTNKPVVSITSSSDGQQLQFATKESDRFITFQRCMSDSVIEL